MAGPRVADPEAYKGESNTITNPGYYAAAITPNDGADLAEATRALYIGGDGNVRVDTKGGDTSIDFIGLVAGTVLPIQVTKVHSTGTTATNIIGIR